MKTLPPALFFCFGLFLSSIAADNPLAGVRGGFFALSVPDAAATARWYEEKLGFRIYDRIDADEHRVQILLLENGDTILEIGQLPGSRALAAVAPEVKERQLLHGLFKTGLVVAELDLAFRVLQERGVPIQHDMRRHPTRGLRSFIIADPEGTLLQILGK